MINIRITISYLRAVFSRVGFTALVPSIVLSMVLCVSSVWAAPPADYTLDWSDEFNGSSLDTSEWSYRVDLSGDSSQRAENVEVTNGNLQINCKIENVDGKNYSAGGVITKREFQFGYFEVSAKLAPDFGWHEAFWTTWARYMGEPKPPGLEYIEIDCFEQHSGLGPHEFSFGAIDWGSLDGSLYREYPTVVPDLTTGYNTWGFEATPDYLRFYFNDEVIKTLPVTNFGMDVFHVWLTTIARFSTQGNPAPSSDNEVFFDYFRAYEIDPADYAVRRDIILAELEIEYPNAQPSSGIDISFLPENIPAPGGWTMNRDGLYVARRGHTDKGTYPPEELTAFAGFNVETGGNYRLWVLARDYASGSGSRYFHSKVNGAFSPTVFGNHGIDGFAWQDGGVFSLSNGVNTLELYDSSRYYARCAGVMLTSDLGYVPVGFPMADNVDYVIGWPPVVDAGTNQTVIISEGPWSPAEINTVAWYDAADASTIIESGGKVSQWDDKSGNARHATQGTSSDQPDYQSSDAMVNNLPSIGTSTSSGSIGLDTPSFSAKHTYVVVYYKDGVDTSFDIHSTLLSGPGTFGQYRILGLQNTGNFSSSSSFNDAGTYMNGAASSSISGVLPMPASQIKFKSSAARTQVYSLGYNSQYNDRDWEGAYCEWIFTDGTEGASTEQMIEGYLAHKWGIEGSLPSEHPYKSAAPGGERATAILNGTVSDADGDPLTTTWSVESGPDVVDFGDSNAVDTVATFYTAGTYVLNLTADDGSNQSSDNVTITVLGGPAFDIASIEAIEGKIILAWDSTSTSSQILTNGTLTNNVWGLYDTYIHGGGSVSWTSTVMTLDKLFFRIEE